MNATPQFPQANEPVDPYALPGSPNTARPDAADPLSSSASASTDGLSGHPVQTYPVQTYPVHTYPVQTYPAESAPTQAHPGQGPSGTYPHGAYPPVANVMARRPSGLGVAALVLGIVLGGFGVRRSHRAMSWFGIVLGVFGLIATLVVDYLVFVAVRHGLDKEGLAGATQHHSSAHVHPTDAGPVHVARGVAGVDGPLAFTVTAVSAQKTIASDPRLEPAVAKGRYLVLAVTVRNSSRAVVPVSILHPVIDNAGREHEHDMHAEITRSIAAGDLTDSHGWPEEVNAHGTRHATLIYDLPVGRHAKSIELHADLLGRGVIVDLPKV